MKEIFLVIGVGFALFFGLVWIVYRICEERDDYVTFWDFVKNARKTHRLSIPLVLLAGSCMMLSHTILIHGPSKARETGRCTAQDGVQMSGVCYKKSSLVIIDVKEK